MYWWFVSDMSLALTILVLVVSTEGGGGVWDNFSLRGVLVARAGVSIVG